MKVFLSWSGELSHKFALVLRNWLPAVIQKIQPYVSSEDIEKGARWSTDISKELQLANFGILIVTKENLAAPWLNFEAGAISKLVDSSHVSPFLINIKKSEVDGPLLQFQLTIFEKDDVYKLLSSINQSCEPPCIDEALLKNTFDVWWPKLEEELESILSETSTKKELKPINQDTISGRHSTMILEEVLELVRNQQKILNNPELLLPPGYFDMLFRELGGRQDFIDNIGPDVIEELQSSLATFHKFLRDHENEKFIPVELVNEFLERIERPISYLIRRLYRSSFMAKRAKG